MDHKGEPMTNVSQALPGHQEAFHAEFQRFRCAETHVVKALGSGITV